MEPLIILKALLQIRKLQKNDLRPLEETLAGRYAGWRSRFCANWKKELGVRGLFLDNRGRGICQIETARGFSLIVQLCTWPKRLKPADDSNGCHISEVSTPVLPGCVGYTGPCHRQHDKCSEGALVFSQPDHDIPVIAGHSR
jgi:hypothetical protein